MSARAVLTPFTEHSGRPSGGLWRKQILRKGAVSLDGRRLDFDDAYVADLVRAFREHAFDRVPLQFADANNTHTEDPERTRGEVVDLIDTPEGLDALIRLSEAGAAVVRENPGLAVSARINEDWRRIDGKSWRAALGHVLATWNPRMTGMTPWRQVALASPDVPVLDLSGATYLAERSSTMELTDEEIAAFRKLLSSSPPPPEPCGEPDELSSEEWEALVAAASEPDVLVTAAPLSMEMSAEATAAIALANANAAAAQQAAASLSADLAARDWALERQAYLDSGVPPVLLDLASQVLHPTIDLANPAAGARAPAAVVREMLGNLKGLIDFGVIGASVAPTPEDSASAMAKAFIDQYGGM